ncbi:ATP-binding cassette domain-containing protein [Frankia sp. AgB1.9]|uniref:ABC transporter ATP-binding protein n=1 Tax=unclassified Frankia TaxID=2632575 RepID=UPI00193438AD|nr:MULTISPECIES: ATP-binding cassette domain-containing protein [unclassified Frankia]MBL7488250.1 ATP-binding cassette domain-containing protein [Frankia sp. AgW1.1]MBL7548107.1 ATP-binding cassette domain-containing protein [Frankia sp. AgB1.9]MBL7620333.1 ATP-binding cassette domain-containing protein [Frankia sp. AgB1.8]
MAEDAAGAALEVRGLTAGYGSLAVIHDVSFSVGRGEIVGLLGRNGAGKTTTLMAIAGFLGKYGGEVRVDGTPLVGPAYRRSRGQVGIVLEGRSTFPSLTVRQNLQLAGAPVDEAIELFPELRPKLPLKAGVLSGGEQQMLALARTVGRHPTVLLIDELSFGLAPAVSERILERLRAVATALSAGVVLVEQHIHFAASFVDRALIMNEGLVRAEIPAAELAARESEIERLYLGGVDEAA